MKKLIAEENLKREKFSGRVIVFLIVAVTLLSIIRVILANRLVEASSTLHNLDERIAQLEADNQQLSEEVRKNESLTAISDQAQALGFIKTEQYSFIKATPNMALGEDLGALR